MRIFSSLRTTPEDTGGARVEGINGGLIQVLLIVVTLTFDQFVHSWTVNRYIRYMLSGQKLVGDFIG